MQREALAMDWGRLTDEAEGKRSEAMDDAERAGWGGFGAGVGRDLVTCKWRWK
jgi:hypothetical protein